MVALADATLRKGAADAEARRLQIEAESSVASRLLVRDVAVKFLDVLPAVTRELMTPAQAIREIKVLQLQGVGSNGHGGANGEGVNGPLGAMSPVLKTVLEAGAAWPLVREMMQFAHVDTDGLAEKAGSLLATLPDELRRIVESDPDLSARVAEITRRGDADKPIAVRPVEPAPTNPAT